MIFFLHLVSFARRRLLLGFTDISKKVMKLLIGSNNKVKMPMTVDREQRRQREVKIVCKNKEREVWDRKSNTYRMSPLSLLQRISINILASRREGP